MLPENIPGAAMAWRVLVVVCWLCALVHPRDTHAAVPLDRDSPDVVEVGVWLSGLHSIDFVRGSFETEFYCWWISANPDFKPFETLQVLNGRDWSFRATSQRRLADGRYHTSGFVSVTVNHNWNLRYFPFDRQKLQIIIETPYTASELRIVPNQNDSAVSQFLDVKGFQIDGLKLIEHVEGYTTDFGFKDAKAQKFSRLTVEVGLNRESERLAIVLLLGFIVSNLIAFFTYAIEVSSIEVRVGMITASIFSAAGNMSYISSEVNPAVGSLIVDGFALGTFATILASLLVGIAVHRLSRWNRVLLARGVNWACFAVAVLASVSYYAWIVRIATR